MTYPEPAVETVRHTLYDAIKSDMDWDWCKYTAENVLAALEAGGWLVRPVTDDDLAVIDAHVRARRGLSTDETLRLIAAVRTERARAVEQLERCASLAEQLERLRKTLYDQDIRHTDTVNELLERAPDTWDDDVSADAIAVRYVRHLEDEVGRLGGCQRSWCMWEDREPCDHGYLDEALAPTAEQVKEAQAG